MTKLIRLVQILLLGTIALGMTATVRAAEFSIAQIYIEYNRTANDLGYHVSLDGEDWRSLSIINPRGKVIFEVKGKAAYKDLGMTELFFEGAEPALDDFPLDELLELFPEGTYKFVGTTVDGERITGRDTLTHAVPDGPVLLPVEQKADKTVVVKWEAVTDVPAGFPQRHLEIAGYQVIVGKFLITLPASARSVTVPKEFVQSLTPGVQLYEVLAIDASGNQTLSEGSLNLP